MKKRIKLSIILIATTLLMVGIFGSTYAFDQSGPQSPVNLKIDLAEGMIPVAYNASGQTIKASANNNAANWYNYDNHQWANAVLVNDTSRSTYQNASTGTLIAEDDILAYFVWIPRFSYTLFNVNANGTTYVPEQEIKVTLQGRNDPVYDGSQNDEELTHEAFWWDKNSNGIREEGEELNGFWVAKFEPSADGPSNAATSNILVKPNKDSWRNVTVSKAFTVSQYFKIKPMYGISTSDLDSHMMKNMEWGAVAYLSNSKYGKRGNDNFSGANKEIYINNYREDEVSNRTKTGGSSGVPNAAVSSTCAYPYPDMSLAGTGASTSGSIYGVYDMGGGAVEYVMGNMAESTEDYTNGVIFPQNAGTAFGTFGTINSVNKLPSKYVTLYDYGTTNGSSDGGAAYMRGKLGDATKEVKMGTALRGWNMDNANFVNATSNWTTRGGAYSSATTAGAFSYSVNTGGIGNMYSFRPVLVLEKSNFDAETKGKIMRQEIPLTYELFGAKGDGITNDAEAISDAHIYANALCKSENIYLTVTANENATYYLGRLRAPIPIQTDVDWNGANFIIDDYVDENNDSVNDVNILANVFNVISDYNYLD